MLLVKVHFYALLRFRLVDEAYPVLLSLRQLGSASPHPELSWSPNFSYKHAMLPFHIPNLILHHRSCKLLYVSRGDEEAIQGITQDSLTSQLFPLYFWFWIEFHESTAFQRSEWKVGFWKDLGIGRTPCKEKVWGTEANHSPVLSLPFFNPVGRQDSLSLVYEVSLPLEIRYWSNMP